MATYLVLCSRKGRAVRIKGDAFKSQEIPCTLIIFWGAFAKEPWYLITDEAIASGRIYGMRFWIEHQFKKIKSDGWHWEKSRITDPRRAERMWLAYAVGMLWTLSFGNQAEQAILPKRLCKSKSYGCQHTLLAEINKKAAPFAKRLASGIFRGGERMVSWFARGIARIAARIAARIYRGDDLQCPRFQIPKYAHITADTAKTKNIPL